MQNIGPARFKDEDAVFISSDYYEQMGDHSVQEGDLIVAGLGDSKNHVGRACVAPSGIEPAMVKADCFRFRLIEELADPAFVAYQFTSTAAGAAMSATGATRSRLNLGATASRQLALPPLTEQHSIVSFLNRETAKIDTLIQKKQRLIELLNEKRAALISHVVTKGLDPGVPMRASGVEWIGDVPAHWAVAPIYARYEVALGKMLDSKRIEGNNMGWYLRNIDVQWDRVNVEDLPQMDFAPSERSRYQLRPGDLLVCEGGEVGRTAMWRGEIEECFYQKAIHRVRPVSDVECSRFFYYFMHAAARNGVFVAGGNPNTIDHLTAVQLRHYRFPCPPGEEQVAAAALLDHETTRIDDLITKIRKAVDYLKEYRAALISAAVTGQIDVRNEV